MVKLLLVWVMLFMTVVVCSQPTVAGSLVDESDLPLQGAYLMIRGTLVGTVTDAGGKFTLTSNQSFPWTVQVIAEGYITRTLIIYYPDDYGSIVLKQGIIPGDAISVTASRRPENSATAVVSVTNLPGQLLEVIPLNGDPTELLRNAPGISLVRSGTESSNIELRGPVNLLETNTLVLKDYAPLTTASGKILTSVAGTLSPLDIAGIEVVRGPSGALYGPNVTSGVVHYLTKDPFRYPGASAMVSAGESNLFTTRVRYAHNNGSKWGWKFLANYSQSKDFYIAEDQMIGNDRVTPVITAQNFETLGGKRWENVDNLDDIHLYNWNIEGGFEFRANDKTKLNYTASLSRARTNITSTMGHLLLGLQRFEQQARLQLGNLFATLYHRHNFANTDKNGNPNHLANHAFLLNYTAGIEGETQFAHSHRAETYVDIALQYRMEVTEKFGLQVGTDAKLSPSFKNELVYGASSEQNAYNIFGSYITAGFHLNKQFLLHAAGRYDYLSAYEKGVFSPQTGIVYSPRSNFEVRVNYNRTYNAPSRAMTWMDYNFSSVLPAYFPATRIQGIAQQVSYDNPVTRFPFGDVEGGELFDLQDIIDAAAVHAGVPSPMVSGTIDPAITTASYAAPMVGFPTGFPITLDQQGSKPVRLSNVNQLELGLDYTYKRKLEINAALYRIWNENIPHSGEVVWSAGSQLNLLEISNILEQQVPPGPDRNALITSLYSVPQNPTTNPGFDGIPGFGVVMSDRAQQFNYAYDLGFFNYGSKNVSYYGADLGATYFVNPVLSIFGNYSYISQTIWSASDLGESNSGYGYYLNTAPDRFNVGINYYPKQGVYGSVAINYQSSFESHYGDGKFFSGVNEARSMVDLQLGYRFNVVNNALFDVGISINNLFDEKYSHFVHLGQLRRFAALSLKVSL